MMIGIISAKTAFLNAAQRSAPVNLRALLYPRFFEIRYSGMMSTRQMMMPGMMPPRNRSPIDTPVLTP